MTYNQLTSDYLCTLFPEFKKSIEEKMQFYETELPHCLYADILNPFLKDYFMNPCMKKEEIVNRIFDLYEDIAKNGDFESKNLLEVSLLEPLYDTKQSYLGAIMFMKNETKKLFNNLSSYLKIPK